MPAGMRPRSLTAMSWSFAHARIWLLRARAEAGRPGRRRCPRPALRACSMNGATCPRNLVAFLALRSITYSAPPSPNSNVWSAGPPSRSSSRTTVILVAIGTSHDRDGPLPYRSCSPTVAVTLPSPMLRGGSGRWRRPGPRLPGRPAAGERDRLDQRLLNPDGAAGRCCVLAQGLGAWMTNEQDEPVAAPGADALHRGGWVSQPVRIYRDQWGIPHVRAQSMHDVFAGQGYSHAMDRLWQMDANRRQMQGRWAEWVGPGGIAADKLARRLGAAAASVRDYEALGAGCAHNGRRLRGRRERLYRDRPGFPWSTAWSAAHRNPGRAGTALPRC